MSEADTTDAPAPAEHFESLGKQEHAVRLGMWIFLGSETLLFAGLFGIYAAYRTDHPAAFFRAAAENSVPIGTLNTVILIVSSFFVAWATHSMRHGRSRSASLSIGATLLLGGAFLVFKGIEYADHFHHGIYPGDYYAFEELPSAGAKLFFTLYYFLTGLHALHVLGGMAALSWILVLSMRRRLRAAYHPELEMGGLYWHLVDVIWIFLWPLLYLSA